MSIAFCEKHAPITRTELRYRYRCFMIKNLAILAILSMPLFAAEVINQPPNLNTMIQQAKDKDTVNANFKDSFPS
jgi:hypothetical protein